MKKRLVDLKKYFCIITGILLISTILLIDASITQNAVKKCIASGQDVKICQELEK